MRKITYKLRRIVCTWIQAKSDLIEWVVKSTREVMWLEVDQRDKGKSTGKKFKWIELQRAWLDWWCGNCPTESLMCVTYPPNLRLKKIVLDGAVRQGKNWWHVSPKIQSDVSRPIMLRFASFYAQNNVQIEENRLHMNSGKVRFNWVSCEVYTWSYVARSWPKGQR